MQPHSLLFNGRDSMLKWQSGLSAGAHEIERFFYLVE
jgi:hypothetical protein